MRAVGLIEFGRSEVLQVTQKPPRPLRADEVLVRVAAAAVNPADLLMREGYLAEAFAKLQKPYVLGLDMSGTVVEIGSAVVDIAIGDRVMAAVNPMRDEGGGQNAHVVLPAASLVPVPPDATMEEAATLMMNGMTAWHALSLAVPDGGVLAVTGGAGWLATIILALAKSRGITTIADAAADERKTVRSNGADIVVDRGEGLAERIRGHVPQGVDGVIDTALIGPAIQPAIRDGGNWVVVRDTEAQTTERAIVRHFALAGTYREDRQVQAALRDLVIDGRLKLLVQEAFPPERAAEAHRRQAAGGVRGRIVISFQDDQVRSG